MGREERRLKERLQRQEANRLKHHPQPWEELSPIEILKLISSVEGDVRYKPDRMYKNHLYSVQVFHRQTEWGLFDKAMIRRHDARPIHDWHELQSIKNDIFGPDVTALEVYPKAENLVDVAEIYWLFVMIDGRDCPIEVKRGGILR